MDLITAIIKNVLTSIYKSLGASLIMAVLFVFAYMYVKDHGYKGAIKSFLNGLRMDKRILCVFLFALYVAMMLFRTAFCRGIWANPLENVIGIWGFYKSDGSIYTENVENTMLFMPLMPLMFMSFKEYLLKSKRYKFLRIIVLSLSISFCVSLCIELSQLLLKIGTFQLTDLAFNTAGGVIGGVIYAIVSGIKHRKKK